MLCFLEDFVERKTAGNEQPEAAEARAREERPQGPRGMKLKRLCFPLTPQASMSADHIRIDGTVLEVRYPCF